MTRPYALFVRALWRYADSPPAEQLLCRCACLVVGLLVLKNTTLLIFTCCSARLRCCHVCAAAPLLSCCNSVDLDCCCSAAEAHARGATAMHFDAPSAAAAAGEHAAAPRAAAAQPEAARYTDTRRETGAPLGAAAPSGAAQRGDLAKSSGAPRSDAPPPEALLGRRVRREFAEGAFVGVVTETRATHAYGQLWRVSYDDGDTEDLSLGELRDALLPADSATEGGATAAGPEERVADASGQAPAAPVLPPLPVGGGSAPAADVASPGGTAAPPRYKGVRCKPAMPGRQRYTAHIFQGGHQVHLGSFSTALEAARAYDTAAREHEVPGLNFPRVGTAEVRAVWQSLPGMNGYYVMEQPQQPPQPQPASGAAAAQPQRRYKGVSPLHGRWQARARYHAYGEQHRLGLFDNPADAARAYDAAVRRHGLLLVNFPRPGTAELQAHPGYSHKATAATQPCARVAKAPTHLPAAGGARGGGTNQRHTSADPSHAAPRRAAQRKRPRSPSPEEEEEEEEEEVAEAPAAPPRAAPVDDAAAVAAVASFLRAMTPPLSCLNASLAALPGSGMSMAHLEAIAAHATSVGAPTPLLQLLLDDTVAALHISAPGERMAFMTALMRLAQRGDGAGGAGGAD
jgi:hypothetical protein